jgi:tetratricopeptide (TPR) repeat protein
MERFSAASAEPGRGAASLVLALAAICAVGAAAYANSFGVPFVYEDWTQLADNPFLRWTALDLDSVRFTLADAPLTRSLPDLSFGLNYWLSGYAPASYHALNLAIHLVNACLVFALGLVTLGRVADPAPVPSRRPWLALAGALVFAVHPIQTEAVTYIAQRPALLSAGFSLASLWLFARGRLAASARAGTAAVAGCAACAALALLSSPGAVVLPIALWLYDFFFLRELRRDARADAALVAFVALCAGASAARGGFATLGDALLSQPRALWQTLSLIALPLPSRLNVAHDVAASRGIFDPATTAGAMLGLIALLALAAVAARRWRLFSFAIAWLVLQLAAASAGSRELVAEHRAYLALAFPCIALALPLARLAAWRTDVARVGAIWLVVSLVCCTVLRNQVWGSETGLWSDAVAKSPNLARAHTQQGVAYARVGMHEEAVASYQRALALLPDSAEIHYDLVFSLRPLGRDAEAQQHLDEALRLAPAHAGALHLLGEDALRRSDFDAAIGHFEAALAADARLAPSYHQLGVALIGKGRVEDAAAPLKVAARLDPRLAQSARETVAEASAKRGLSRLASGDQAGAAADLRAALAAAPTDAIAANALAWILATSHDPELRDAPQAVVAAELAQRARPDDADFLDTLGAAYAAAGRFTEAVTAAERADALASARGDDGLRDRIRERLRHYRAGEAWVEGS